MTEPIKLPPMLLDLYASMRNQEQLDAVDAYARLAVEQNIEQATADLRAELSVIRATLTGSDADSLPNDYTTVRMAATIRAERDKFMWQVRDTCARAEKAEAERDELARLTTLRPASEHDGVAEVLWWGNGEFRYIGNEGDDWLCWTTLPDVKEPK
jgi:hypothetical protein